jgi:hypothetical protein
MRPSILALYLLGSASMAFAEGQPAIGVLHAIGAEVVEGTGAPQQWAKLLVTMVSHSSEEARVSYATESAGAIAGEDFESVSGVLVFPAGEARTQTILVPIHGDGADEPHEDFRFVLSNAVNATIGDAVGLATIVNDDSPSQPAPPTVSSASVRVSERAGEAVIALTLSKPSTRYVGVSYVVRDGTATPVADYLAAAGMVVFEPGETTKEIRVTIIDDARVEHDETIEVRLTSSGATIGEAFSVVTIVDDRYWLRRRGIRH